MSETATGAILAVCPCGKRPKKLLMAVGEVLAYPICQGKPINPYAVGKEFAWVKAWKQDAWGAFVVAERGLMFGYLAWYRPLVITEPTVKPAGLVESTPIFLPAML